MLSVRTTSSGSGRNSLPGPAKSTLQVLLTAAEASEFRYTT